MSEGEAAEAALVALLERLAARVVPTQPVIINELKLLRDEAAHCEVLTGHEIIRAVRMVVGVSERDFMSPRRCRTFCEARQIAYWFMRHYTRLSYPQIGRMIGMRDHSTVVHGFHAVEADPDKFRSRIEAVARLLKIELPLEVPFQ